jgi:DNA excision repair protein ERCC-3
MTLSDFISENPLIVQSDHTVLLEIHSPKAEAAREAIAPFAELVKSPEHVHTYRMTPLSIWNARAAGLSVAEMVATLRDYAKYSIPKAVAQEINSLGRRYGLTVIERAEGGLLLRVVEPSLAELLVRDERVAPLLGKRLSSLSFFADSGQRGVLKQALVALGYPAEDVAGYVEGEPLALNLRTVCRSGEGFGLRAYQCDAAAAFYQSGRAQGGSGVIVLPCGSGKTIVGMAAMAAIGESTLVLTTSLTSIHQWRRELLDKTDLPEDAIAEYSGEVKNTGLVTLSTYQILTYRPSREQDFVHFELFHARPWGLIIYDKFICCRRRCSG